MFCHYPKIHIPPYILAVLSKKSPVWIATLFRQTKRGLKSRLAEHKRATLNQKPEQSALCVHAMEFHHNIDWINAKILKVENNYSKRLVSEAWFINSQPNVLNRSDGGKLSQVYQMLFQ